MFVDKRQLPELIVAAALASAIFVAGFAFADRAHEWRRAQTPPTLAFWPGEGIPVPYPGEHYYVLANNGSKPLCGFRTRMTLATEP